MRRADALVQADGRLQFPLQLGVVDDVVVGQRLLDHHEIKIVEPLEMIGVLQRVGRIGIRHQLDGREPLAHLADHVDVPPGLDFHLDALVTGCELEVDLFEQLRHRFLNADGDAARNLAPRSAANLPATAALALNRASRIPDGRLDARRAMRWPRMCPNQGCDIIRAFRLFCEDRWHA